MGTQTFYLLSTAADPSVGHRGMDSIVAPGAGTSTTGWTVAKVAAGNYSLMSGGIERASGTFASTPQPNGAPITTDCFRTLTVLSGTFAAGTWNLRFPVIAVSSGGDQDGRMRYRMWRGANASGAGAVELTAGARACSGVVNLGTGAEQISSDSLSLGAFTVSGEYLFVQCAWEITGAGGANSRDVLLRVGPTAHIVTTDLQLVETLLTTATVQTIGEDAVAVEQSLAADATIQAAAEEGVENEQTDDKLFANDTDRAVAIAATVTVADQHTSSGITAESPSLTVVSVSASTDVTIGVVGSTEATGAVAIAVDQQASVASVEGIGATTAALAVKGSFQDTGFATVVLTLQAAGATATETTGAMLLEVTTPAEQVAGIEAPDATISATSVAAAPVVAGESAILAAIATVDAVDATDSVVGAETTAEFVVDSPAVLARAVDGPKVTAGGTPAVDAAGVFVVASQVAGAAEPTIADASAAGQDVAMLSAVHEIVVADGIVNLQFHTVLVVESITSEAPAGHQDSLASVAILDALVVVEGLTNLEAPALVGVLSPGTDAIASRRDDPMSSLSLESGTDGSGIMLEASVAVTTGGPTSLSEQGVPQDSPVAGLTVVPSPTEGAAMPDASSLAAAVGADGVDRATKQDNLTLGGVADVSAVTGGQAVAETPDATISATPTTAAPVVAGESVILAASAAVGATDCVVGTETAAEFVIGSPVVLSGAIDVLEVTAEVTPAVDAAGVFVVASQVAGAAEPTVTDASAAGDTASVASVGTLAASETHAAPDAPVFTSAGLALVTDNIAAPDDSATTANISPEARAATVSVAAPGVIGTLVPEAAEGFTPASQDAPQVIVGVVVGTIDVVITSDPPPVPRIKARVASRPFQVRVASRGRTRA